MYKFFLAACGLYLATGYLIGTTCFGSPPGDSRLLLLAGMAAFFFYCIMTLWLWGNDTMLGVEKSVWTVLPWALILLGFIGYFVVPQ